MYKEAVSIDEPQEIEKGLDTVYLRKDIKKVEVNHEDGTKRYEYHYLEEELPLKEWELQQALNKRDAELATLEDAVTELAALMA